MKVTLTNDGKFPIKVMQRQQATKFVEIDSESDEIVETFIQPGESLEVVGIYKAVEMTPTDDRPDTLMYSGGGE